MDEILVSRHGGAVTVTLNRPARMNAITRSMWRDLRTIFDDIAGRREDRTVIVTGAGSAFCSGADLGNSGEANRPAIALMRDIGNAALALHALPQPTIARVDGPAVGAGLSLAVACDLVVASDRSRFCAIFSKRALSVDFGGSWLLPRLIGLQRAKELVLFGDMLDAHEALRCGLINTVTPVADLDRTVAAWADRLVAGPQHAMAMSKQMLNRSFELTMDQALEAEAFAQTINLGGPDVAEGRKAFQEKRSPNFT